MYKNSSYLILIYYKCYTSPCQPAFTMVKLPIDAGNS